MLIEKVRIGELIPHSGKMCLLDAALSWDADRICCIASSHHDPTNPLRRGGRLGAACGIEYAAQAMALHGALIDGHGHRSRVGLLASVRDLVLHVPCLHDLEENLTIEVQRLIGEDSRVIYRFDVKAGSTLLLSGRAAVVLDAGNQAAA